MDALPGGGPDGLAENVSFAAAMLAKLAGRAGLQAAFLRDHLEHELAEEQRFWYRLPVTPYNAMTLSSYRSEIFAAAVDTVSGHADASPELLVPRERRAGLAPGPAGRLGDGVTRILHGRLAAAFLRLLDDLAADEHAGGEGVGIGQYPGGADCYVGLIGLQTGLDLCADEVHAIGLAEVERITERVRDELAITDEPGYRARLAADPGMYAKTPADVERLFQRSIDRLLPLLPRYFARLPDAPFLLRPLDAALSGLTYGYYQPPGAEGAGYYHYNVANLPFPGK